MIKRICSVALSIFVAFSSITVLADNFSTDEGGVLTVNGSINVSEFKSDYWLTGSDRISYALFSKEDFDGLSDGIYAADIAKAVYIGQTSLDRDSGNYEISLKIRANTGDYKLVVFDALGVTEVHEVKHVSYYYTEFNEAIGDRNAMSEFIESYKNTVGIDLNAYNRFNDDARNEYLDRIVNSQEVSSNDEAAKILLSVNLANILFKTSDADTLVSYFNEVANVQGHSFNTPIIKYFTKELTAAQQKAILSDYAGKDMPNSFEDELVYKIFNAKSSAITYYMDRAVIIEYEGNPFGFNENTITEYINSKNQKGILKTFAQRLSSVANMEDVYNALDYAVKNPEEEEKSSGGSGSGGGSKGSGSGGGKTLITVPATPSINQNESTDENKGDTFSDMIGFEWAKTAVNTLKAKGIVNGISEDVFAPSEAVTREQFVKMVTASLRLTGAEAEVQFNDVSKGDWFYNAVGAAARAGIVSGLEDGAFGVGRSITREDMAVMLNRAASAKGVALKSVTNANFADEENISDYAKTAVSTLAAAGIINGSDGKFNPKQYLTRAEAAKVLYEFLTNTGLV